MLDRLRTEAQAVSVLARAGALGIGSPLNARTVVRAVRDYGPFAGASAVAAAKHGDQVAIIDDAGPLTYAQLDADVRRLAAAWQLQGVAPGTTIGILCRNSRAPLTAAFAGGRLGATVVWLNAEFAPPQCVEVCTREQVDLVVHDRELSDRLEGLPLRLGALDVGLDGTGALAQLCATGPDFRVARPASRGKLILLTSGTTGTPKGAQRSEPRSLVLPAALVDRIGLRHQERMFIAPPLFHGTGLGFALVVMALGGTIVVRRRFDAARCLADLADHDVTALVAVPVMLRRLLEAPSTRATPSLRAIVSAGSRMPADLPAAVMDRFGDVLFNLYGSTETGGGTIAVPGELRADPASAGRPWLGTELRVLDEGRHDLPVGRTGAIFIRSASIPTFGGYTGGGSKEMVDGFVASGDLGHLDAGGRLVVDGRDDEMIVSGGENVFPGEVEDLLESHAAVVEAAIVAVEDPEFGQRLMAFVVAAPGSGLVADDVQGYVRGHLARYKVPREVVFVERLPRTATGKVMKRALTAD